MRHLPASMNRAWSPRLRNRGLREVTGSTGSLTAVDDRLKARNLAKGDRVCDMQGRSLGIRMLVILAIAAFFHFELFHTPARGLLCGELQGLGFLRSHWAPPGLTTWTSIVS